jgi:hypothetical protein
LLSRFFNGSREMLVMDLLGHEEVSDTQLRKVRELLDSAQADTGSSGSGRKGRR